MGMTTGTTMDGVSSMGTWRRRSKGLRGRRRGEGAERRGGRGFEVGGMVGFSQYRPLSLGF